jgi:hypothetical protein
MTRLERVGDIDVPQDVPYERKAYRVRQVVAVVFAAVLVAALLGLLGRSGPLSDATARGDGLAVGYERFLRVKSPTQLDVQIGAGGGPTRIAISRALLDELQVDGSSAQPQQTSLRPDRVVYTFDQQPPSQVTFVVEPQRAGRLRGTVYGPGGATVSFSQWVWP